MADELELIVQRMLDAGESQDSIKLVIENYDTVVDQPEWVVKPMYKTDLGIPTPVGSTGFDQMFVEDSQIKIQRYTHIDENTFSSSLIESNITNREDNLKAKLEEHYKDTGIKFDIKNWDGNRIEIILPGEKKGQFFDLPSDPIEAKAKYIEMVEYMEDRTAVPVGEKTTNQLQELFDFDYKSATAETAEGGLFERVNDSKVQEILGSDYEVKKSGFFKNALEITVPGGGKKTFPKSSSSEDILSFIRRNPRSRKQTKAYQTEKEEVTEEAKVDLKEAVAKRLLYSQGIDGSTSRTPKQILTLLNNPDYFNKMKNDILSDVTSTWWTRNKDNNELKNLSNSDIDEIRSSLVQTALENHKINLTETLTSSGEAYEKKRGQTRESIEAKQRKDHLTGRELEELQIAELWAKIKNPKLASEKEDNLVLLNTAQILYNEKNASKPYQFNYDINKLSRPLVLDEKNKDIVNLTARVQETTIAYEELPADALDGELFDVSIAYDQALREFKTKKLKVPITDYNKEVKYLTAEQKNKYIVDKTKYGLNAKGQSVRIGDFDAYFNVTAEEAASLGLRDDLLRANATFVTDLAVRKEALVRLQVFNQRSTTVGRSGFFEALKGSAAASVGIKTDSPNSQLVVAMNDAMVDAGVELTREEKKLYHKQGIISGEALGEALGGLPKLVIDFAVANKLAAGVQTVTGINTLLKALNARRYAKIVKGRKVFMKPPAHLTVAGEEVALANWAVKSGLAVESFAPHIASRAASTVITSLIEGVKMEAVLGPGSFSTGVGFGLAGKLIPWPVIRGSNWGRTLFDYGVKSPINFTIGAEAGEIMNGLTSDIMNKKDFRDFMKEHYSDYTEVGQRTITNLFVGFAMRLSHVSKMDFKSAQGIRDVMIEATKKRDRAHESLVPEKGIGPTLPGKIVNPVTGETTFEGKTKDFIDAQQLIIDLAKKRLAEINNTEIYLDPVLGPLKLANDLRGSSEKLIEELKKQGKEIENVRIEYTNERLKGNYRLDGKDIIYQINPKYIEPGVAPHEIGHAGMELLCSVDAILRGEVVEAIDNISKDILMDDGRTLFETVEGTGKGDKEYDINRVTLSEKFTYLAEAMKNKQIAKQIRAKYGFDMYGKFLAKWSKKNLNTDLVFNTEKRVAEWMNNYVETIRKGKSPLRNFEHLQEWISPEATKEQMKARVAYEKSGRNRDGSLNSELLNRREQELTQEIDKLNDLRKAGKLTIDQYKEQAGELLKERFEVRELIAKGLPIQTGEDQKFEVDVESMYNNTAMPKGDRAFFIAEMWDPTGYTNLKTGKKTRYAKDSQEAAEFEKTNGEQGFKEMPAGALALKNALKKHQNVDGFAENIDLIIEDITTGFGKESKIKGSKKINKARSVRQLILDYKAIDHPGVPLSGYINSVLFGVKNRYLEGVNYYTAESKIGWRTSMQNARGVAGDVNKSTYITTEKDISQYGDTRVIFELPINNKAFKQKGGWKETILKNLDPTKHKSFKSTPDLAPKFTREMMGVKLTKAQEAKPNDLSQKSLEGIQNFIEAKFKVEKIEVVDGVEQVKIDSKTKLPETREVSMAETFKTLLNEGAIAFDKGVSDVLVGTSTGNRKTFLKEFYHEATKKELIGLGFKISEKTGRVETAAGGRPKVLNENITVEQIKRFIGIDPVTGVRKTIKEGPLQDRSLAGKGRGILELFGENISKQEARLSDKLTVNQMFDMGAGRNRAILSEVLGRESFENQKSFLEEVKSENFALMLEKNKKLYPKNQTKALEKTLLDHFVLAEGHDIKTKTLKAIAKELSKEFKFTKIGVEKIRVAAAKQIAFKNVLKNIEKEHGVEVYEDISKMFDKEGVEEAKVLDKILAKELIKKHGIGVYEAIMKSATSSGAGVGVFKTTADLLANDPTQRLRYSIYRNAKEVDAMIADVIRQLKSEGVKLKTYKETTRAESDVQSAKKNLIKRIVDKVTGEFSITKAIKQYKVGEENKKILKDALDTVLELYKADADGNRQITSKQVRQFVEIHAGSMPGLIKKAASLAILPTGKMKDLIKKYGSMEKWVLEHTTPAQYVKARIYDYILSEGNSVKKEALDLTLRDYHTTFIPKGLDTMVNKILQTNLPSNHLPGMDPIQARYYETVHVSDFDIGLRAFAGHRAGRVYDKNITLSQVEKQKRSKEIRASLDALLPSIVKVSKAKLNSEILNDMKNIDKALAEGRKRKKETKGMSTWDFDDTLARTKSGVRYTLPNPSGKPAPGKKVIFMAGGAGSGKSGVIKQLGLKKQGFKIVNSDISLEWLKKNHGLPENMKDLTKEQASKLGKLQWEARKIAARKQMKYQGKGDGIVVDGTGGSLKVMEKQVQEFKDKGYDVQMVFVETSLETAIKRNANRAERSLRESIVERNHESVQANKKGFKELFGNNFAEVKTDNLKQTDAMPSDLVTKLDAFTKGYIKARLNAGEFATEGAILKEQGAEFDFAEFNVVKEGEQGPFFQKALDRAKKFGTKDQFILTARPPEAAIPIHEFLKAQGLDIPLKNITGLGNSTGEAKAMWMLEKFAEGYNDIYFADDAAQNVKAVKTALDQLKIKSKIVQAKAQKEKILNNIKDVNKLDSPDTFSQVLYSEVHRSEYEKTISKHRPDLVKEGLVSKTVDNMFNFIDTLDVSANKKKKYEQVTTKWLATSSIKLKEDAYKVKQAVELAEKYKEDIFSYRNPNELIEKYAGKTKEKPINPKSVKEFRFSGSHKEKGISLYEVENTKEGQKAVRKIIDTHWGVDSNPWCITQSKEGKLTEDAWKNWEAYKKGPKRIVFHNGKLSSFYANRQYWDRMDNATDAPTVIIKKGRATSKVELVPMGEGKIEEFVRETRTVSKDKKTVTTEIFADSQDGYIEGTKIVENRVNGITVKSTRYNPKGKAVEIKEFGKDGKGTASYNFFRDGKMSAVNSYGRPFEDMSAYDIIMKKGDLVSHQMNEGGNAYFHGRVKVWGIPGLPAKVAEIGWKVPIKNSDLKNFIKTVDGKVRVDLKKIVEVDPDIKGLPKDFKIAETGMKTIKPVKTVLDQLDIKSEVQQTLKSEVLNKDINDMMEYSLDIQSGKIFSKAEAKVRGKDIKRRRVFLSDSAADLELLIEPLFGKGKQGIENKKWFDKEFVDPFERGIKDYNTARQNAKNDYIGLRKQNKDVVKELNKPAGETTFTNDMAIRVYLWNKAGYKIPDLAKTTEAKLVEHIKSNPKLQAYAETFATITKQEKGLKKPSAEWWGETLAGEVTNIGRGVSRKQYLQEWIDIKNEIFSSENFNKMESKLGTRWRENIEDMFDRMETGRTRSLKMDRGSAMMMNYLNGSIGTIMNFNTRSAALQTISTTNFLNMRENNPIAAAKAMGNIKQFSKDFMDIMNSDMLKQRRDGLEINVTEAEIASAAAESKNPIQSIIAKVLKVGYLPTKLADSFAISLGGATFYRNRAKMYQKQGLSLKEAEAKAWMDFQKLSERTQQSSRPDLLSRQQTSLIGRFVLPFANTPMQMNRHGAKEILDISKGRYKDNVELAEKMGRITYFMGIQVALFAGLQSALFAMLFNDEDVSEEKLQKTKTYTLNTVSDSMLRGMGVQGATISAFKNAVIAFLKEDAKANPDYSEVGEALLNISPPVGSKFSKLDQAGNILKYDDTGEGFKFELGNPSLEAATLTVEAIANIPVNRAYKKSNNIMHSLNSDYENWQRALMMGGWSPWNVGIESDKKKKKKSTLSEYEKWQLKQKKKQEKILSR